MQIYTFYVIILLMNILTATKRGKADKLDAIRSNGMVPAVVYGVRVENTMLSVPAINFEKIFNIAGETSAIVLEIKDENGSSKKVDVLIHDVQLDPLKSNPIHIDFLAIDMNKKVTVNIPIEFIGIAPAEKDGLGNLVKALYEIEIEALPKDIPHNIEVNLSSLTTLDSQIRVCDIKLPNGIEVLTDKEEVLASITTIKEEIEETPVDLSSIEVEKKGKKEEEGESKEESK